MGNSARSIPRFQPASDQSLLIYFDSFAGKASPRAARAKAAHPQKQDVLAAHESVRKLLLLLEAEPVAGVRNLHPGYASLLVKFDPLLLSHRDLEKVLRSYFERLPKIHLPAARHVEISVCYGGEFGPDLPDVAAAHGISPDHVVELHTSRRYLVYFLGFVPGFAYLGELPEELVTPRLSTPRRSVPAGSVGIAGNQTGVYPFSTPGGWRLLGRTPLKMFQPGRRELSLLAIGDLVKFTPISPEKYAELQTA
jgi:inhibitor of KinA